MYARINKLTSILLVVLYSLVGLTGVSLHYLVDSLSEENHAVASIWLRKKKSVGYLHSHGPDYHVHYHHSHSHETALANQQEYSKADSDQTTLTTAVNYHVDHACPLLTIVSTLKLGLVARCSTPIDLDPQGRFSSQVSSFYIFEWTSCHLARGPPLVSSVGIVPTHCLLTFA